MIGVETSWIVRQFHPGVWISSILHHEKEHVYKDQLLWVLVCFVLQDPLAIQTQGSFDRVLALHITHSQAVHFLVDQDSAMFYTIDGSGCLPPRSLPCWCSFGKTLQFLVEMGDTGAVSVRNHKVLCLSI